MATKQPTKANEPVNLTNIVIIAIVVSTISLIVLFIVGRIFIGQIILKNKIISADAKAEQQLKNNIGAINSLSDEYNGLGAAKKKIIADALPAKPDFPALSSLMENLAKASNIKLQSVSAAATIAGAPITTTAPSVAGTQSFAFTIAVQGSYASIKTLLGNLESSAQPMRVSNITVGGSTDVLSVQLAITTYYQSTSDLTPKTEVIQ